MTHFRLLLFLFLPLLLTACRTDYPAAAVESARRYLLDHTRELPETDRSYLRYADPVIMTSPIIASQQPEFMDTDHIRTRYSKDTVLSPEHDFMQICIVWQLPGSPESLVVTGTGQRDMRFWEPYSLVRKQFIPKNALREKVRTDALLFAVNALPGLKKEETEFIRFADPEILVTDFLFESKSKLENARKKGGWMEYLAKAAEETEMENEQFSAVWRLPGSAFCVIVAGPSDGSLAGWIPEQAYYLTSDELKKYTVRSFAKDAKK